MKDHTPIITGVMHNASEADSLTHEQCQGATILWKEYLGKSKWITCSLSTSDLDITAELKVIKVFLNNLQSLALILQPVFGNQDATFTTELENDLYEDKWPTGFNSISQVWYECPQLEHVIFIQIHQWKYHRLRKPFLFSSCLD